MIPRCKFISLIFVAVSLIISSSCLAETLNVTGRGVLQYTPPAELREKSLGERIVYWAQTFLGTPYDTDPLGKYVREERIVADDAVDCMYLTFRAVELALSQSQQEAQDKALDLRFIGRGKLEGDRVVNYNERFEYGEDMIDSGKWGREITSELGRIAVIKGSRGRDKVSIIPKEELLRIAGPGKMASIGPLKDGDIIFFVKAPTRRIVGEIVGHIGIITIKEGTAYLLHAGGKKRSLGSSGGGIVKSEKLPEYIDNMGFAGARITRFE